MLARKIPDLRGIVDFRNQLAHGYHLIDPQVVWEGAVDELPVLRRTVQALLAELDAAASNRNAGDDASGGPFDIPDPFKPPSPLD